MEHIHKPHASNIWDEDGKDDAKTLWPQTQVKKTKSENLNSI